MSIDHDHSSAATPVAIDAREHQLLVAAIDSYLDKQVLWDDPDYAVETAGAVSLRARLVALALPDDHSRVSIALGDGDAATLREALDAHAYWVISPPASRSDGYWNDCPEADAVAGFADELDRRREGVTFSDLAVTTAPVVPSPGDDASTPTL